MGTHSLIIMRVKNTNGEYTPYCALYQQFDGHIEHVGKILFDFLSKITLTNGISMVFIGRKLVPPPNTANGAGCLFAQIVKLFKSDVGGAYLVNPVTAETDLEEYNYFVDVDEHTLTTSVKVSLYDNVLYEGSANEAFNTCMQKMHEEEKMQEMEDRQDQMENEINANI